MSLDEYAKAGWEVHLRQGTIRVHPSAFGRTVGQFPGERLIHLFPAPVTTDPKNDSVICGADLDRQLSAMAEANVERLKAAKVERTGGGTQRALALVGLSREQAVNLGRALGLDHVAEWSPRHLALLSSSGQESRYTGWSIVTTPPEPRLDEFAAMDPEGEHDTAREAVHEAPKEQGFAERAAESARMHSEREQRQTTYFAALAREPGCLFALTSAFSDSQPDVNIEVWSTGSTIEIREGGVKQGDAIRVENASTELPHALKPVARLEETTVTPGTWRADAIAHLLCPALSAEIDVNGTLWYPAGHTALPENVEAFAIAEEAWDLEGGGGSPGNADAGTYYLLRVGPDLLVVLVSSGETSIEPFAASPLDEAIETFHALYGPAQ